MLALVEREKNHSRQGAQSDMAHKCQVGLGQRGDQGE